MVPQSTVETTSTEILAAAALAAALPDYSDSARTAALSLTGSYSATTTILPSDLHIDLNLDTQAPFLPTDLQRGDEIAFRSYLLAYRAILSMLRRRGGDTDIGSWNEGVGVRPFQSSNSPRGHYLPAALTEHSSRSDTSGMQAFYSETADVAAPYFVPEVSSDSLFSEIDRWLRDLRTHAQTELSAKALYRIEVQRWLRSLDAQGEKNLSDRLALLRSVVDEDEEDDVPLSDEATLGFMDFLADVRFDGNRMSLTSANGWLCTEWEYDDGRSLVLWFKDRIGTIVTAFGSDGKLIAHLGRNPSATSRPDAAALLVSEGFFAWRPQCSI